MSKTIAFFSGSISNTGGTERVCTQIANGLHRRGYKVLIISQLSGDGVKFELEEGIEVVSLFDRERFGKRNALKYISVIRKLHSEVKRRKIDYLIDVDVYLSLFSIPATAFTKTKVVSWEHFNFKNNNGIKHRDYARKLAVKFSHAIVTLTEKDKGYYQSSLKCNDNIQAIYNPFVKDERFTTDLPPKEKVVLAVGRYTYQKGFDLMLNVWKHVASDFPDWKLSFVGDGENKEELVKSAHDLKISDSVNFLPFTDQITTEYQKASIYAMTSRYEGLPLVLIEGKSNGLPIVSFDCETGPSDIIRDGVDGFLIEDKEEKQFAEKLRKLMGDDSLRKEFAEKAIEDHRFDYETILDKWCELLV